MLTRQRGNQKQRKQSLCVANGHIELVFNPDLAVRVIVQCFLKFVLTVNWLIMGEVINARLILLFLTWLPGQLVIGADEVGQVAAGRGGEVGWYPSQAFLRGGVWPEQTAGGWCASGLAAACGGRLKLFQCRPGSGLLFVC